MGRWSSDVAAAVGIVVATAVTVGALTCMGDDGVPVDWWILVKQTSSGSYVYLDSRGQPGALSRYSLASATEGALARTVNAAMAQSFAFYQDWPPAGAVPPPQNACVPKPGGGYSHSAGIIGVSNDAATGFVMPHNFVRFPNPSGPYSGFPLSSSPLASTAMCLSMSKSNINAVLATMNAHPPFFFRLSLAPSVASSLPLINWFCSGKRGPTRPPYIQYATTARGLKVTTFLKEKPMDIYSVFMTGYYKADMYTQTWMHGHGVPLPNVCRPNATYQVINLDAFSLNGITLPAALDHSKLAFIPTKGVFCLGDANRMGKIVEPGRVHCVELPSFLKTIQYTVMGGGCDPPSATPKPSPSPSPSRKPKRKLHAQDSRSD